MSEQRARIEKALHECAEMGIPDTVDLWPEIRERAVSKPRRMRRFRFVPRTRAGWAFAVLVTLLVLSTGAYATGGIMDALDFISGQTVPYIQKHRLGVPVDKKQSRDGVTVTIDRVYADSAYVVVGFHVDGLDKLADEPSNPRDDLLPTWGFLVLQQRWAAGSFPRHTDTGVAGCILTRLPLAFLHHPKDRR